MKDTILGIVEESDRTIGNSEKHFDDGGEVSTLQTDNVQELFTGFAKALDAKHDKYERLVKKSRDVTVESKRIIFSLHRVMNCEEDTQQLKHAGERLAKLENTVLRQISRELVAEDPHLFSRAISPGIQEYVEAVTLFVYLASGGNKMASCEDIQRRLTYTSDTNNTPSPTHLYPHSSEFFSTAAVAAEPISSGDSAQPTFTASHSKISTTCCVPVLYNDYMLGLMDLTGELMRRCINCASSRDNSHQCCQLRNFLQQTYQGALSVGNKALRDFVHKTSVLERSVVKVERASYQLALRGGHVPSHVLAHVLATSTPCDVTCQPQTDD